MKPIELIGHVDDQHRLHVELPADLQPGPVKITLQAATDEEEAKDWSSQTNHARSANWSDPREDIYTLQDGKPSHESHCDSLRDVARR